MQKWANPIHVLAGPVLAAVPIYLERHFFIQVSFWPGLTYLELG